MSNAAQKIFKRIVLHNKLLSEAGVESLLADNPDPEQAIAQLAQQNILSEKKAEQFLVLYRKQMAKAAEQVSASDNEPDVTDEDTSPEESAAPVVKSEPLPDGGVELIHRLLEEARDAGAADLHIMSGKVPVARINGMLQDLPLPEIDAEVCEQSLIELLDEEQNEQFLDTNDLDFCYDGGEELGRFRTNFLRQHHGMDAVFRLIPSRVPSFEELDLPEQVRKFTEHRVGIVLITGPKGCGKTTTLAAMIDSINSNRAEHIITVEDPIEFVQHCKKSHVNQREVGIHTKSFSNALRAALREAPT